jgi:hypothetical protein
VASQNAVDLSVHSWAAVAHAQVNLPLPEVLQVPNRGPFAVVGPEMSIEVFRDRFVEDMGPRSLIKEI